MIFWTLKIAVVVELVGLAIMSFVAVKSYFELRRRRKDAIGAFLGPLFMAMGIAALLARRFYFGPFSIIPLGVATPALVVGAVLNLCGFFIIMNEWRRGRTKG